MSKLKISAIIILLLHAESVFGGSTSFNLCKTCLANDEIAWCPDTDDFIQGSCYTK